MQRRRFLEMARKCCPEMAEAASLVHLGQGKYVAVTHNGWVAVFVSGEAMSLARQDVPLGVDRVFTLQEVRGFGRTSRPEPRQERSRQATIPRRQGGESVRRRVGMAVLESEDFEDPRPLTREELAKKAGCSKGAIDLMAAMGDLEVEDGKLFLSPRLLGWLIPVAALAVAAREVLT